MRSSLVLLSLVASTLCATPASAACADGAKLPDYAGKRIVLARDTLFLRTHELALDIDGSPQAYGVHDQGLEDICNGLGPLEPPACRGKNRKPCYVACQQAFRKWDGSPATLGKWMCSIGLGGGGCSVPQVRIQPAPRELFFVSETSVHPQPEQGISLPDWIKRQEGQLDSEKVPYFVIPGGFRAPPWDATPGDVGVVVKMPDGDAIPFIVGDTGGNLDEASAMLLATLRGVDRLPRETRRNSLGDNVERLAGAMTGDFRIAIFRHSAPYAGAKDRKSLVIARTAAELPTFIRDTAQSRLDTVGGRDAVVQCTN